MVYIQMHMVGGGGADCKVCFVAGNTQSLHFSCVDTAYVGMQGMESTLVFPNPFQAVKLLAFIYRNCMYQNSVTWQLHIIRMDTDKMRNKTMITVIYF